MRVVKGRGGCGRGESRVVGKGEEGERKGERLKPNKTLTLISNMLYTS